MALFISSTNQSAPYSTKLSSQSDSRGHSTRRAAYARNVTFAREAAIHAFGPKAIPALDEPD